MDYIFVLMDYGLVIIDYVFVIMDYEFLVTDYGFFIMDYGFDSRFGIIAKNKFELLRICQKSGFFISYTCFWRESLIYYNEIRKEIHCYESVIHHKNPRSIIKHP